MKKSNLFLAMFCVLFLVGCGVEVVDTGHRGVKTRFGKVIGDSLPEGLYFYNPITTTISEMDTRVQKWSAKTEAYTNDVQQVEVSFTVNFALERKKRTRYVPRCRYRVGGPLAPTNCGR